MARWTCNWEGRWHIVIPSSQETTWPWSLLSNEGAAEAAFEFEYPLIYGNLKKHESQLKKRTDKGVFWWELRSCDYYHIFAKPKILVQCIAYDSHFLVDTEGFYINNSSLLIPSGDLYLLAVLNSRTMWWIINRTFPHMKDDAISMEIQYLENVPIPEADSDMRSKIETSTRELIESKASENYTRVLELERHLSSLVERAFGLTDSESELISASLPPRDPLDRQQERLMKEAMKMGKPYQTLLDPPPTDPLVTHPPKSDGEPKLKGTLINIGAGQFYCQACKKEATSTHQC